MIPGELIGQSDQAAKSASVAVPLKVTPTPASLALLDLAHEAFQGGNARAALALLAQHAHRFPGKQGEEERQDLLPLVCMDPAVHGATECADMVPNHGMDESFEGLER